MSSFRRKIVFLVFLIFPCLLHAQQIADTSYHPAIQSPHYFSGAGPIIFIDEGHHNFHTKNERYSPFAKLLERDGYNVNGYSGTFESTKLSKGKILVIANALNEANVGNWYKPVHSAFTDHEIEVVHDWVQSGGSLFLIADHMPMAGAAKKLAAAFGFEFTDGFAMDSTSRGGDFFKKSDFSLSENIITNGLNQVVSFTGQAFKIPIDATPILTLNKKFVNILPDTAWVFSASALQQSAEGWS